MLDRLIVAVPILLVGISAMLHIIGERQAQRLRARSGSGGGAERARLARRRAWCFYAGLATILVALVGPIDSYAGRLFWVHMIQHVLLLSVAAPLIVLGAPWMSIWRPLPLGFRRGCAGTVARAPWAAPLRIAGRALGTPAGALLAFSVDLVAWHIPGLYDLTLRHLWIHVIEHLTFLTFGILLWAQAIASPPLRPRLSPIHRVYYMVASMLPGWVISLVLAFSPRPLYSVYVHIADRPGGISALIDQQLAGGIMLVFGSLSTVIYIFVGLYRWLAIEGEADQRAERRQGAAPGAAPS